MSSKKKSRKRNIKFWLRVINGNCELITSFFHEILIPNRIRNYLFVKTTDDVFNEQVKDDENETMPLKED